MRKVTIITAAVVLLFGISAFAQQGPMGHCGKGHGGFGKGDGKGIGLQMLLKFGDELELTDQQKAEFAKMAEDFGMERIERDAELDKARLKLRTLRMNEASDSEVLRAMDEVGKLRTEMQKMRYQHRQLIKAKLTDTQLEKLKELRQERMGRRGGCGGPCEGPCEGHGKMKDGQGPHGRRG